MATKKYPAMIRTGHQEKINVEQYVISGLEDNVLSVVEMIKIQGPIVFTQTGVYRIPAQLLQIKKLGKPITMFENGSYRMEIIIQGVPDLHTGQSDTHLNWVKHAKSARISSRRKTENANNKQPSSPKIAPPMQEPQHVSLSPNIPSHQGFTPGNCTPQYDRSVNGPVEKLHHWHRILSHAHTDAIRKWLKAHNHPDGASIRENQNIEKNYRNTQ